MEETSKNNETAQGSTIEPPLGLIPKKFHDERVRVERFNEVCGAISRYYYAGLKINIEWIEEYNELVESVGNKDLHIANVVEQSAQLCQYKNCNEKHYMYGYCKHHLAQQDF